MSELQRTREWYKARQGKMTASEAYLLLGNGRKKEPFTKQCFSWLDKKVAERLVPPEVFADRMEENPSSVSLRWGIEWEDEARRVYEMRTGQKVDEVFFEHNGIIGGSPDGVIRNSHNIIEIKCPYTLETHLNHLLYVSQEDLKADNLQYYTQCQVNMMLMGSDFCDFVSYHPEFSADIQMSILTIIPDKEFINTLIDKAEMAKAYMDNRIKRINQIRLAE